MEAVEGEGMKCKGRIWVDSSRWFPRRKGTVKQWQKGRLCRAWAMKGSDYCVAHQDQEHK